MNDISDKKSPQLFLIDGYGYLFRAYHAMPPLTNPEGTPVGAVFGFTNMLLRLLERLRPHIEKHETYLAVVLDAGQKNFRHDIDPSYKANRPPAPEDLIPQFPLIRSASEAFRIKTVDQVGYEADDIIATYAKQAAAKGMKVTIVSSDKDLMQLVDDKIEMYDPVKDKRIGINEVKEKFGVEPRQVQDVLALMGDSSDNVPGVPGIGPKTAAELISTYGSLDNLYAHVEEIKQAKRKETLITAKDKAYLSRELVGLCETVSLEPVEALEYRALEQTELLTFLTTHGFTSLVKRLQKEWGTNHVVDTPSGASSVQAAPRLKPEAAPLSVEQVKDIAALIAWLKKQKLAETKAALWVGKETLAVAVSPNRAAAANVQTAPVIRDLLDFAAPSAEGGGTDEAIRKLADALNGNLLVGYDAKGWLKLAPDITLQDVEIMRYVLGDTALPEELAEGSEAERAAKLYALHTELSQGIFDKRLSNIYHRVDQPLQPVLAAMEAKGIKVDAAFLKGLSDKFGAEMAVLEKEIHQLGKGEFNIGSPKQLGEVLFDRLGLPGGKKSKKTGAYGTDADVLEALAAEGHEIATKVLAWRGLSKLKSTYTDALPNAINPKTGRVHTTFNQVIATTGRLSSVHPNLQNIPIRTEEGRQIRKAFVAENGNVLVSADYSQIELRLLAHMADIPPLRQAFRNNVDIHTQTASQVFGIPKEQVDSAMRRSAKAINFGIIYGQSAFGLAASLGIPRDQASAYIKAYFEQFPGIQRYMEETKEFARSHGYVQTLFGRKCYTPLIHDKIPARRQFAERAAINAPLQGTAADIIKRAMIRLHEALSPARGALRGQESESALSRAPSRSQEATRGAFIILQVHDELVIECPQADAEKISALTKKTMEGAASLSVPLTVEVSMGKEWS